MSIFAKLFKKKEEEGEKVGGIQDFMTLIRVYYQAVMASNLGITNVAFLPDMAVFKRTLKIPTQNSKLGVAEKSRCKKMLMSIYNMSEEFFKEIDNSIKKNCNCCGKEFTCCALCLAIVSNYTKTELKSFCL